jgi:peptidoglycan hydrolase-like protein with peptidoglycan-binding domain
MAQERTPGTGSIVGLFLVAILLAAGIIAGAIYLRDPGGARADNANELASEETTEAETVDFVATEATIALQETLTELGYYDGPIDGDYGAATVAAVTALQESLGITADGRYGPDTHKALVEAELAAATEFTKVLQQGLKDLGYYDGEVDGAYGPQTADAVKAFQTDFGLNVDGVAGPETVNALHGALEAQAAEASAETTS